jgi:hypothetical protein
LIKSVEDNLRNELLFFPHEVRNLPVLIIYVPGDKLVVRFVADFPTRLIDKKPFAFLD